VTVAEVQIQKMDREVSIYLLLRIFFYYI